MKIDFEIDKIVRKDEENTENITDRNLINKNYKVLKPPLIQKMKMFTSVVASVNHRRKRN